MEKEKQRSFCKTKESIMKQIHYSLIIFVIFGLFFMFSQHSIPEYDIRFAFEKDGCKVYSFKSFDGVIQKKHYFTSCKGNIVDPDEVNFTEVDNEKD